VGEANQERKPSFDPAGHPVRDPRLGTRDTLEQNSQFLSRGRGSL
jgi:hypothetical protein